VSGAVNALSPAAGTLRSPVAAQGWCPDAPAVGALVAGKYRIEGVLGAGGMGVVVAAQHEQLGQPVAIKFLRGDAALDQGAVGRFLREARATVALSNEHVTRILDVGTLESGAPYMVMEYLAGVEVGEMLQRSGPLAVDVAVDVVLQACEAIAEAHARGIVHRDLKPANLFVTMRSDGSRLVKVLDFGISKAIDVEASEQSLTMSGTVMGSPGYMSPEQVRSAKAVDTRTDIWALGVILYELLSGSCPFTGETLGDTIAKIISEDPPPLSLARPDVPEDLVATIAQCLARDVGARIQSVAELAVRLLPFAGSGAEVSVKRIQGMAGQSAAAAHAGPAVFAATLVQASAGISSGGIGLGARKAAGLPSRLRLRLGMAAIAGGLCAAGIAAFLALRGTAPRPLASPASASASTWTSPEPRKDDAPAPRPSASARVQDVAPPSAPDQRTAAASRAAPPSSGSAKASHRTLPPPNASAGRDRAPAVAADCDPPVTIDSAGFRIVKPGCF
jgi:serine/threonine-protein kinase